MQRIVAALGSTQPRHDLYRPQVVINSNEEMFQTEGRGPDGAFQTEGRARQEADGQRLAAPARPLFTITGDAADALPVYLPPAQPAPGFNTGNRAPNAPGAQPVNRTDALPVLQPGTFTATGASQAQPQPPPPPANPDGNRLSSNRQENRSTLVVESRDPARQNAVIHRSYIKK